MKNQIATLIIALSFLFFQNAWSQKHIPAEIPSKPSDWKVESWAFPSSLDWEKKNVGTWGLGPSSTVFHEGKYWMLYGQYEYGLASSPNGYSNWHRENAGIPVLEYWGKSRSRECGLKHPDLGQYGDGSLAKWNNQWVALATHDDHLGSTKRYPVLLTSKDGKIWENHKISGIDRYTSNLLYNDVDNKWYAFWFSRARIIQVSVGAAPNTLKHIGKDILKPSEKWENNQRTGAATQYPHVLRDKNGWIMLYTGNFGTGIGLARSDDLLNWKKINLLVSMDKLPFAPLHFYSIVPIVNKSEGRVIWKLYFNNKGSGGRGFVATASSPILGGNTSSFKRVKKNIHFAQTKPLDKKKKQFNLKGQLKQANGSSSY